MAGRKDFSVSAANFEWHSLARDVARNSVLILLAFLIGMMGVYVATRGKFEPEYTGTAVLAVNVEDDNGATLSNLSLSQEMAEVLQKVLSGDAIRSRAAQHLGQEGFGGTVSGSLIKGTNLVRVRVTANDSGTAYDLLSAMLEVCPSVSEELFANGAVRLVSGPQLSCGSVQSGVISGKLVKGGLAAAMLMLLAILALSFFRDTVKNERAFRERIDGRLLAKIWHVSRKRRDVGRKDRAVLITDPSAGFFFKESFEKLAARIDDLGRRHGYRIFMLGSVSGNEGRTSVAVNIALALERKGKRVLLVDCNRIRPAVHRILGMTRREWRAAAPAACGLRMYRVKGSNLCAAVKPVSDPGDADMMLSDEMQRFLKDARSRFDYVFIDTPPLDAMTPGALSPAIDATMLVVRTDRSYVADINDAIDALREAKAPMLGCVLNDVYPVCAFAGRGYSENNDETDEGDAADDGREGA